jgi:plastocyanin
VKEVVYIAIILCFFVIETRATVNQSQQADTVTVVVKGTDRDARFDPVVVKIAPGDIIRFVVEEGLHTVTAYHPENRRSLRMPEAANAFDSGLLKSGDSWFLQIDVPGVYDYFCLPHERMAHAGRILAGAVKSVPDYPTGRIPEVILKKLTSETNSFFN